MTHARPSELPAEEGRPRARLAALVCLLVAIALAIPFAVDFAGTISFSILHAVVLVLLIGSGIQLVRGAPLCRGGERETLLLFLILALGLCSLSYSRNIPRGIAMWALSAFLFAGFWVVRQRLNRPAHVLGLADAFLAIGLPVCLLGIAQARLPEDAVPHWSGYNYVFLGSRSFVRPLGTFENALYFAIFCSTLFSVSMARTLTARSYRRVLGVAALLVSGTALAHTASIGGLMGCVAGSTVALVLGRPARALVLPLMAGVGWAAMPGAFRLKLIGAVAGFSASGPARLVLYRTSLDLIQANPLLGSGLGSMEEAIRSGHRQSYAAAVAFNAENFFLQRAVESGVAMLILYVLLVTIAFRRCAHGWRQGVLTGNRERQDAARVVTAFLVAFFVQAMTISVGSFALMALLGVFVGLASVVGDVAASDAGPGSSSAAAGAR